MMFFSQNKIVCWLLVAIVTASPTLVAAQQGAQKNAAEGAAVAAEGADKVDLSYVTPDAMTALVTHPRRVLTSPNLEMLPIEILSALGKQELGLDPLDVESMMAIVEPPQQGPPGFALVIRLAKAYRLDEFKLPGGIPLEEAQLEGRPYRRSDNPMVPGLYMPDDKTLLVGTDDLLKKMLANKKTPVEGPLSQLLGKINTSADLMLVSLVEPVRPMLNAQLADAPLPPPLVGLKRLPDLIDAAKIELNVSGQMSASLVLLSPSEEDTEELQGILNQLLDMGQQLALAQVATAITGDDPVEQASQQYARRMTQRIFDMIRPKKAGKSLRIEQTGMGGAQIAIIGTLVALLLPAVQAAREAARRASSRNNLKQIGLAMHNYHDTYKKFPARANFDDQGKPLLSWRVHILPYIDQQPLYERFHLDEPWDSPHNKQLIDQMPQIYHNPSGDSAPDKANYLLPVGEDTIFAGQEGTSIAKITDGTSNTIMVLEADSDVAVIWTKPEDLEHNADNPLAGLGNAHPGGFSAAFADGSVHFLRSTIDPKTFLLLLMKSDGKVIGDF